MASVSLLESKIKRLQTQIKSLEAKRSSSINDESKALSKISKAQLSLSKTKSSSTISSKLREIERENKNIVKLKETQAKLSQDISKKNIEINKLSSDLNGARQKEQLDLLEKIREEQRFSLDNLNASSHEELNKEFDVFISHSADDKDSFVSELVQALKNNNISIWYDTDSIGWGKSIRDEIDKGLANSRYGIVVISPTFIDKYWTKYELDGILSKESSTGRQMFLPIWHNITADQVQKFSFSLANKLALNTAVNTIDNIVENVQSMLK